MIPNDDIVLIDKPAGMSSFGVVARIRRVLSQQLGKKAKVGHTGTLDPFATGLMILVTGKKCKEAGSFTKLDKWYRAEIILGVTSTTGDPEGELTPMSEHQPTIEEVRQAVQKFIGVIEQTPPAFSAIKINGQRAYQLARKGQEVVMPVRQITVYDIEIASYNYPNLCINTHVSSGTYIRTLAEDIGNYLGTGAYCQSLRRTKIADFTIDQAVELSDFGIEN